MTDASSASDLAGARHLGHQVQAGEHAVAGRRVLAHDHVARLLAAEREAAFGHRLEHVAVADAGLRPRGCRVRPSRGAGRGCSSRSTTSVSSVSVPRSFIATARIAMIWSPSTTLPSASTARQRSASPSWAMPTSAPCSRTAACSELEVRRADAVVDVQAVGVGADDGDPRAGVAERLGRDAGCRAVRAVEHDVEAVEAVRQRAEQVHDVAVLGVGEPPDAADAAAGGRELLLAEVATRCAARPRRGASCRRARRS